MSIKKIISVFILSICTSLSVADDNVVEASEVDNIGFSVGLGIPYGGLGINISRDIAEQFEITGGLGVFGWAVGGRYYPSQESPRFRLSGIYGTNTIVMIETCGYAGSSSNCISEYKDYQGINFGIGFGPRGNEDGWNLDVILILTQGDFKSDRDEMESQGIEIDDDGGAIKFSGGYTWRY
jgi:hypothetical protein